MALLQISEPGQAPDPHQRRVAVGIDLGTTHSLVAALRHGQPECLADPQGDVLLPSVVRYLPDGSTQAGEPARQVQSEDPENTIVSVKRLMGRRLADLAGASRLPYRFVDSPGMVSIDTCAGPKSPVEVSAEILATAASARRGQLRQRAVRRGDHRAGLLRRRPAPGHQGRRHSWPA
jgi:molecular chaperone HscA